jgi:phosphoenolpyruvate-protein phosphotransferase
VVASAKRPAAPRRTLEAGEVDGERRRLDAALARAEAELLALQEEVAGRLGAAEAGIFGAQALVVRDASLREGVLRAVEEQHLNLEAALADAFEAFARALGAATDLTLGERAADVRDVGRRVLQALVECDAASCPSIPDGAIVVAEELLPSATARLELDRVRGFVTERGNKFSHSSILARALGMPAVVGVPEASRRIRSGERLIVDGVAGIVFVDPDASIEREYERVEAELRGYEEGLRHLAALPSVTVDGTPVPLLANVNKLSDTEAAHLYNAEGIGLYRTEFGFTVRSRFPTEDEQVEFLERAAERFHPREVVFRLVDLGGDKVLPYFPLPPSRNPALGRRGIRLLLDHPEVLKPQLRAFLRVSARHPVSILMPVVSGLDEVRQLREVLRQVQDELTAAGKRFGARVPLGAMIEVPSAALIARRLASEVDFLSLGTNDLVQYVLAADREDETVAPYYQPLHPAVLRLIQSVAEGARSAGRHLTLCGEMGGDPLYTELLLGLGLERLSVAPGEMLEVKAAIRGTRLDEARHLAAAALELGSASEIESLLRERFARRAGVAAARGTVAPPRAGSGEASPDGPR